MFLSNLTELTLSHGYRRFFKVVPALTAELPAENHRIRHQLYCREPGDQPLRAEGLEADAYDDQPVHCLVPSLSNAQSVGGARLVLAVYLYLITLARHYAITTLLVLTERHLATNLARLGVRVEQIGGEIEHRGIRMPSMMAVDEIIGGMNFVIRALFESVSRAVQEGLEAAGEQAVRAKHHPFCQ